MFIPDLIRKLLGKQGILLRNYANGVDDSPVLEAAAGAAEKYQPIGNAPVPFRKFGRFRSNHALYCRSFG